MEIRNGVHYYSISEFNRVGNIENVNLCIMATRAAKGKRLDAQCGNHRGFGPGGLYCRLHARRIQEQTDKEDKRQ